MFLYSGSRIVYHSSQTFTASGTFTVPRTVTTLTVTVVGSGGYGGVPDFVPPFAGAGGGGGAEVVIGTVTVVPGEAITVTVGTTVGFGADGNPSSLVGTFGTVTAAGGFGGTDGSGGSGGSGGNGGGAGGGTGGGAEVAGTNGSSNVVGSLTYYGGGGGGGGNNGALGGADGGDGYGQNSLQEGGGYDVTYGRGSSDGVVIITW